MTIEQLITKLKNLTGDNWIYEETSPSLISFYSTNIAYNLIIEGKVIFTVTKDCIDPMDQHSFAANKLVGDIIDFKLFKEINP
jgi:hypothetical protein